MVNWLSYPDNIPASQMSDFVVLTPNPNRSNRRCYGERELPKYVTELALWTGTGFVDYQYQPLRVDFFFELPEQPKEA